MKLYRGMRASLPVLAAALVGVSSTSIAGSDWTLVAKLSADGKPKEVSVNKTVSAIRIVCVQEPVMVTTVVVRDGGRKEGHSVARTFKKKETAEIELKAAQNVTGLRISDGKGGSYEVYVRAAKDSDDKKADDADKKADDKEPEKAGKWALDEEIQAGGGGKEVAVGKTISKIKIRCTGGEIIINTIVIRSDAAPKPIAVEVKLQEKKEHVITLDEKQDVTGLRISDGGKGRYIVSVSGK